MPKIPVQRSRAEIERELLRALHVKQEARGRDLRRPAAATDTKSGQNYGASGSEGGDGVLRDEKRSIRFSSASVAFSRSLRVGSCLRMFCASAS